MKRAINLLKWIFKSRGLIMAPPLIFATLCTWNETENEFVIYGAGGGIFVAGLLLRIWAQMHLHYRLKVHKALTTTGPYGFVRNPIYIANTLMLVGAVILSELLWLAPVMVVYCVIVYNIVVRFEESHLLDKYAGDYADYMSKVPRWLPLPASACKSEMVNARQFLFPSIYAELPSLLLLLPFLFKEMVFG